MKSVQVPISAIGSGVYVTFGSAEVPPSARTYPFPSLKTEWLDPFLDENHLTSENLRPHGTVFLVQEGGLIRAHAKLEFAPLLECIRCADEFRGGIQVDASALFVDERKYSTPQNERSEQAGKHSKLTELELTADDLETYYYSGLNIRLDEFLLDILQTHLPDQPLCKPECRGLCTQCGTNLNCDEGGSENLCNKCSNHHDKN